MKKYIALICLLLIAISSPAQQTKNSMLQDSVFTWNGIPKLKTADYPRPFTPRQLEYPGLFAQWLQQSYTPIGALDFSLAVAEPNQTDEVQPYGTGLKAAMWSPMWDRSGTKVVKTAHSEYSVFVVTNVIIDAEPIPMLSNPGRSVFVRRSPDVEKAFMGSSERMNQFVKQFKLEDHPQIGKYSFQYFGCDGDGCQPLVAVYLAPGNKLPIRQLSRGEVLDMSEQAIPAEALAAREKIKKENSYRMDEQEKWLKHFEDETLPRWKANIQKLRDKYSQSLNEPAEMKTNSGIRMINFYNGDDLFDTEDAIRLKSNTYGIYTYEDGVLEKSKQDQPLWICISWNPADIQNPPYLREIHRSMVTHFNFDYAYDYFFDPEKVKNKPYTASNETIQKAHLASYMEKGSAKPTETKTLPANVFYFEDFSSGSMGQKPPGWFMPSVGEPSVIAVPPGESGSWVKLNQYRLMPAEMKDALPENFKMEFEVATAKNFTEETGGSFLLKIHNKILTPNGDYKNAPTQITIDLDASAGNATLGPHPKGYTRLKATYTGMESSIRYADVLQYNNDFSNRKSKVHFTITKEGNKVRGYIDGKEITALDEYGKPIPGFNELPDGATFTSFYFENITDSASKHLGVYITNIRITKL